MKIRLTFLAAAIAASSTMQADVLKMKQGGAVQGMLVSANSQQIVFLGTDGMQKTFRTSGVAGIDFAQLPPPPPPAKAAAAAVVVPAGTRITVRMLDSIDGKATVSSQRYRATVDDPVTVGDNIVIPRGADCTVQVVQVESGKDLDLKLHDITIGGKNYPTATDYAAVKAEGTSKGRKALRRGVGLGAMGAGIGALAGGGDGAAIGAIVGGGVGAVSAAKARGKQVNLAAESRLSFTLTSPLAIR